MKTMVPTSLVAIAATGAIVNPNATPNIIFFNIVFLLSKRPEVGVNVIQIGE
ncbi:hypothetical protein [Acidithiobacillus sp.]